MAVYVKPLTLWCRMQALGENYVNANNVLLGTPLRQISSFNSLVLFLFIYITCT